MNTPDISKSLTRLDSIAKRATPEPFAELLDASDNAVYWMLQKHALEAEEGQHSLASKPGYLLRLQSAAKTAKANARLLALAPHVAELAKALADACPMLYSAGHEGKITEIDMQMYRAAFDQARAALASLARDLEGNR